MTDFELIQDCLAGNQEAFTEIVARYKNLVYSIILRMVTDREDANDLAQEVFLKIYRNLASYSPEFKFSTWTMRITSNHVIDYRRKQKQDSVSLEMVEATLVANPDDMPEAVLIRNEEADRVQRLLDELPSMYRIPIEMYHKADMSYQEIADELGEPISKVKNRIFRGRKIIKARYLEEGGIT